jgi:hypothetical protein
LKAKENAEMNRHEKADELLARAQKLGFCLSLDSGLMMARRTTSAEPERQQLTVEELGKYLPEVRDSLERRAICTRTKQWVGRPVWSPEHGDGVVVSADNENGMLAVTFMKEATGQPITFMMSAAALLFVVDRESSGAPSPAEEPPTPVAEKPPKRFFGQNLGRDGRK